MPIDQTTSEAEAPARSYFGRAAASYDSRSRTLPWSLLRALEARRLDVALGDVRGAHVLELGCGAGFYTRRLIAHGAAHVTAVDFAPEMIAQLPTDKVTGVCADATTVSFAQPFAVMLSAGLLEFAPDPHGVLSNARRFVEPHGRFALMTAAKGVASRRYAAFHRRNGIAITCFTGAALADLAAASGWRLVARRRAGPLAHVCALVPVPDPGRD